jgi:hypothetical protein
MEHNNDTVTTGHVSFRWDGKQLILTTQQEQISITPDGVFDLLELLFRHHDEIDREAKALPRLGS